jgi:hypothetical protein
MSTYGVGLVDGSFPGLPKVLMTLLCFVYPHLVTSYTQKRMIVVEVRISVVGDDGPDNE